MKKIIAIAVLVGVLIVAALPLVGGSFSYRDMLGLGGPEEAKADTAQAGGGAGTGHDWAKPSKESPSGTLDLSQIENVLASVRPDQRQAVLSDADTFKKFVSQEAANESVLAAARANNLEKDAQTAFLMRREAEAILRESYLARLISNKIPAGFPSDQQVKDYYDKHKDEFVLGDRVYIWQIFMPVTKGMDDKSMAALKKQADDLSADLAKGKVDFAAAAMAHSAHSPSRYNGGFMGLVKLDDLKPEIRQAVTALNEGAISKPVRTDEGFHILKRGAMVAKQPITYDQVKDKIRELLVNEARTQLRKAIYEQAGKSYPVEVSDNKIEEWRLRLRTNMQDGADKAPAKKK